jgi:hypothetical protein
MSQKKREKIFFCSAWSFRSADDFSFWADFWFVENFDCPCGCLFGYDFAFLMGFFLGSSVVLTDRYEKLGTCRRGLEVVS